MKNHRYVLEYDYSWHIYDTVSKQVRQRFSSLAEASEAQRKIFDELKKHD